MYSPKEKNCIEVFKDQKIYKANQSLKKVEKVKKMLWKGKMYGTVTRREKICKITGPHGRHAPKKLDGKERKEGFNCGGGCEGLKQNCK